MAQISLTDFTSQQADIARRQKLAEMLSEQGQQEIPIQSYNGTQAAIPWTAVLAKALQSAAGAYIGKRNSDEQDALQQKMRDAQNSSIEGFNNAGGPPPDTTYMSGPQGMPAPAAPPPQMSPQGAPIANDDYAGMAAAGPPGPSPQNVAMALSADPTTQAAPPQAMAAALGPQPAMATNDDYAGAAQQQASGAPPAPMPAPAPPHQAAAPPPAAAPAPVPGSIEDRAARAHAQLQVALKMQQQFGPTFAAPYLKAAQEQSAKIQDIQDKAAEVAQEHAADIGSATKLVTALPGLDNNTRALLAPIAAAGGMKALTPALTKLVDNQLGPHDTYMSPQAMQAAGFGPGSIVQVNSVTGETKVLVDGTKVAQENRRIGLEAQNTALHAKSVGLEGARLQMDREKQANAALEPATISQMAQQALAGDTSVFQNLGRGAQGAQNIVALRNEMYRQAQARGMKPEQIAAMNAMFFGKKAEARAAGTRAGATDVATSEVPDLAQEALAAHAAIPQTNLVPFNRAMQMYQAGTSSPELARAVTANQAVINAYARSFGTGVTSDTARKEAGSLLQNAWGTPAYSAAVNQILRNVQVERHGAKAALDAIGNDAPAPLPAAAGGHPANLPAGSMWSPSRRQYKTPSGQILDAQGNPVGG